MTVSGQSEYCWLSDLLQRHPGAFLQDIGDGKVTKPVKKLGDGYGDETRFGYACPLAKLARQAG